MGKYLAPSFSQNKVVFKKNKLKWTHTHTHMKQNDGYSIFSEISFRNVWQELLWERTRLEFRDFWIVWLHFCFVLKKMNNNERYLLT